MDHERYYIVVQDQLWDRPSGDFDRGLFRLSASTDFYKHMSVQGYTALVGLSEHEIGLATPIEGLTIKFVAGGPEAVESLVGSGLLGKSISHDSPFDETDLLRFVASPDGFLMLTFYRSGSVGFIIGQIHRVGRNKVQLFCHRAWTQGKPAWSKMALKTLELIAESLGVTEIVLICPNRIAPLLKRTHGFEPAGVYMVRRVK